jgi:hypothetical protein
MSLEPLSSTHTDAHTQFFAFLDEFIQCASCGEIFSCEEILARADLQPTIITLLDSTICSGGVIGILTKEEYDTYTQQFKGLCAPRRKHFVEYYKKKATAFSEKDFVINSRGSCTADSRGIRLG